MKEVRIEVIKQNTSFIRNDDLIKKCTKFLEANMIVSGAILNELDEDLSKHVRSIIIEEFEDQDKKIILPDVKINWCVYNLKEPDPQVEFFDDDADTMLYTPTLLPSEEFHGIWESLIYDTDVKENLLKYVSTMVTFSEKGVNSHLISSNRMVILHGPPGTGKTSLCKAVAQKLSVRLYNQYKLSQLIEINSHNLFSKWFSESGKLVTKLFSYIYTALDNNQIFTVVLIDEIETLALARTSCLSGSDPTDSVRVVNAFLTQLDKIKKYQNVLLLATSNMKNGIDEALVDRADITPHIGLPSARAIYEIFHSCIKELMRVGIINPVVELIPARTMKVPDYEKSCPCELSKTLMKLSFACEGLSARMLRKIPVTVYSYFLKSQTEVTIAQFLEGLVKAAKYCKVEVFFCKD